MMTQYVSGWLIFGLVCLLLELTAPGLFFCLSLAFATVPAAVCAWYELLPFWQMVTFVTSSLISFLVLYLCVGTSGQKDAHYKSGVDALPGKRGVVIHEMHQNHVGQVQVEGEIWSAQSVHQDTLKKGTLIVVVRVEGVRLIVRADK